MSTIEQVIADLQGQATIWAIVACAAIAAVIILVAVMLGFNPCYDGLTSRTSITS